MENLIAWIVSFMVMLAPPGRPSYIPEATESKDEASVRYDGIAHDIHAVIWNPEEKQLFRGKNGRSRTTALILSIMLNESAFRKDVDVGVGKYARGDGGRSWCLMQLNLGSGKTRPWNQKKYRFAKSPCRPPCPDEQQTSATCKKGPPDDPRYCDPPDEIRDGVTGREMVEDRKICIREGLHALHGVLCTALPTREWLRGYASGSCSAGSEESHRRMDLAITWYANHKPGFTDDDIMNPAPPPTRLPEEMPNAMILTPPRFNVAINDALIAGTLVR